jgi:hypothetical protein
MARVASSKPFQQPGTRSPGSASTLADNTESLLRTLDNRGPIGVEIEHGADPFHDEEERHDKKIVAALDTEYQAAVKNNDAPTRDRILGDEFALVTGSGKMYTKADLIAEARRGRARYDRRDDADETVRVWGDAAVITARLTEKGTDDGKRFKYGAWFSDTYVRTASGWRYAFAQSSLPLPKGPRETNNCIALP